MRAVFINDQSRYHAGSALVTREFHRLCDAQGISLSANARRADFAIINGEGTPHHDRPGARRLLDQMAALSTRMPVALLNTVWDGMSTDLHGVHLIATRESLSAQALQGKTGNVEVKMLPDISLCCRHRYEGQHNRKGWLFVDSVCGKARSWLKKAAAAWGGRYLELCRWPGSAEELIDLMAENEAVVSGRFHGVVLALLADTPVIALPSNTHKTLGMMTDFGIGTSYCSTPEALDEALEERRFGRIARSELDRIECEWRSTFASLRDLAKETKAQRRTDLKRSAPKAKTPASLLTQINPLTMNAQDERFLLNAVLWDRDQHQVLAALNGGHQNGILLRVGHPGGVLEIRDPVAPSTLHETLRNHGVNLTLPFDLEARPVLVESDLIGLSTPPFATMADEPALEAENQASPVGESHLGAPTLPQETTYVRPTRLAPMFFRADGGTVDLADLYRGQMLFLVLNGASLKDFDWEKLRRPGICGMGVNNGAHGFRPQFWTCVDDPSRFMLSIWQDPNIQKFVPQPHFEKPIWDTDRDVLSNLKVRDFPNVLGYRRNERFQAGKWLHEDTFNWGNHQQYGGGRSVMLVALRLAYILGFRRVYLLGCDFQMDEQNRYWFDEQRTASAIRNNTDSYRRLTGYFEQLKPYFDRAGFEVFNANPESQLKVFPFVDLDDALCGAEVRTSASTHGMYVDRLKAPALPKEEYREFLEPLLAAVNAAEVVSDPFVHVQLSGVFPETTYRALLAQLPEDRCYQELRHADAILPDGKSARLRFGFGDTEMAGLPPEQRAFWQRVLQALRDPALEKAFREKLKAGLHERFRDSLSEIVLRPVPELIRDLSGYRIDAHTGIFKKVISTQFYLPEDDSQEALGTGFYRRGSDGKFDTIHRMPFLPGSGYAFAVHSRSWHGVEMLPTLARPRNSLMLTYYLKKG